MAALAWNDLIKTIFVETFGITAIGATVICAIMVTIIAVILTATIAKVVSKTKSVLRQEIFKYELCAFETKMESKFVEHQIKNHVSSPDKFFIK